MHKQTFWYEIYSGRTINREYFDKYFEQNGDDESWFIYYIEKADEPWFELHAHIKDDKVISVKPFKADVYGGHGRPIIEEHSLNTSEKKYAIEIFEKCFQDRIGEKIFDIIKSAVADNVECNGYKIKKGSSSFVIFTSPESKEVKLQNKHLLKALDYSHIDISLLRDESAVKEFSKCIGLKLWEPLAAILFNVDSTNYPEYNELDRVYRYNRMEKAVRSGSIEQCSKYIDVLKNNKNNVQSFCTIAISENNEELLRWLIENIDGALCNLNTVLGVAISEDKDDLFYFLLDSGLFDANSSDSKNWNSPVFAAAYKPGREKYVMPLLKKGFSMSHHTAYRLYSTYSLDDIVELLPYNVDFDQNTINRIYEENRVDIINELEKQPLKYCTVGNLFVAYIISKNYDKFAKMLRSGYVNNSCDLFAKAYDNSVKWTDLWIDCGFDINCNNSRLLHMACEELKTEMAIYLLERGADPQLRDKYSQTVFEKVAGFHGYLDDKQQQEKERLCKYLLSIGLNPILESRKTPSILQYMMGGSEEFSLFLIDWLAENDLINIPDTNPESGDQEHFPISVVLAPITGKYNSKLLRRFIENGAKLNLKGIENKGLFISACEHCDLPELKLVISAGANINEIDKIYSKQGTNGLYAAVSSNRPYEIIEFLVEIGLDVNSMRPEIPWSWGSSKIVPAESVLDIAEKLGNLEIIELLKSKGAKHSNELLSKD